ncbi:MAG: hypothetical protein COB15_09385 [Flavobacteriales bacterium]|nr:MAG: hypothetical protein COB15_09385 [Flavobacteriales bacterium]
MKKLIFILIILSSLISNGQDIGAIYTTGTRTKEYVKDYIQKEIDKGWFSNDTTSVINETEDSLIYHVKSTLYKFTLKMTFNLTDDKKLYHCDYQEYIFDCEDWSIKNFDRLKSYLKHYGFKQINENTYLSTYHWKTKLTIKYKAGIKGCLSLKFSHDDKSKKEYKTYHKSLSSMDIEKLQFPLN